ncbi:MAG: hypothetical protein DRQ88_08860 [Epsilonproteobacteria bacterium]|nr:MAG: hypothetical protein DRQ89_08865 [Campylobacterota bacterium]RLA65692.1 MAG: hypothetical protein DRQ88_08860 [Campylobacterota bacterium]
MGIRTLTFLLLIISFKSFGASCCGGGVIMPLLITGDYRAQFNFTASNSAVTYSVGEDGDFQKRDGTNQEVINTFTLRGAYQISDYLQLGLSLPLQNSNKRTLNREESSTGIGDIRLQMAYEFLPELSFSFWKPRGFIFLNQIFPTSRSTYDSIDPLRTDAHGGGFFKTSIGVGLVKIIKTMDFQAMGEVHQGIKRSFDNITVDPSGGHSFLLGAGFNPGNFRFGSSLLYSYEGIAEINGQINSKAQSRYFWELGFNVNYLIDGFSIMAYYSDQSFFGKAKNTTLSKTLGIGLMKFIEL